MTPNWTLALIFTGIIAVCLHLRTARGEPLNEPYLELVGAPHTGGRYIQHQENRDAVCTGGRYIDLPSGCTCGRYITRSHSLRASLEEERRMERKVLG